MKRIVLISCVKKKLSREAKAEDLYISPLFKYSLEYAKSLRPDEIFILSAKYGLMNPEKVIEPYDKTCKNMSTKERKEWAGEIISKLKKVTNLKKDEFIFLTGEYYRKHLIPHIVNYKIPMKGLKFGQQLSYLKEKTLINEKCNQLHRWANNLKRMTFPFREEEIPLNGLYILFQKEEIAHGGDRIVRVGTHTGRDQLRSRLKQHFINENKDRSIFRKNIGRCILSKNKDKFLEKWELDLTPKKNKDKYSRLIDFDKQKEIEKYVSRYIQNNFSFAIIEIEDKQKRLELESKIVSTVSLCGKCHPSRNWLGLFSPKSKIRESGLWLVNELYKEPLSYKDISGLKKSRN